MTQKLKINIQNVMRIAKEAGEVILTYYDKPGEVTFKDDASPLTQADLAAHDVIAAGLKALNLSIPIVSEEADVPPYEVRKVWQRFWLVDPLDGTKEFLKHNNEFTVNIALIEEEKPILGVVYAPALKLLYAAEQGRGAWKQSLEGDLKPICVNRPNSDQGLVAVESRSHPGQGMDVDTKHPIAKRHYMGSSLKFCYVADGRAHLYIRQSPSMEWDLAAGDCIYRYATIAKRRSNPSPLTYNKKDLRNGPFIIGVAD